LRLHGLNGEITDLANNGELQDEEALPARWTPVYIRAIQLGVVGGDVTKVQCLPMSKNFERDEDQKLSLADIQNAIQILPVTSQLWICLAILPESMGLEQWRALTDNAVDMDTFWLESREEFPVGEGCDMEVGRLVSRAKKVMICNVSFHDFDLFIKGVRQGLGEDAGCCEEIEFRFPLDEVRNRIPEMAERLGWVNKEAGWPTIVRPNSLT